MSTQNQVVPSSRSLVVRPLDGQNQIYDNIPAGATVRDLKQRIFAEHGIQIQNQKLIYGPEILDGIVEATKIGMFSVRSLSFHRREVVGFL